MQSDDVITAHHPDAAAPEREVQAWHDLVAGGIAGSASVVVGHPFDSAKVRIQTSATATISGQFSSFKGFMSLFRGMGPPLSAAAIVNAVIFASYGTSSRYWDQYIATPSPEAKHDSVQKAFICGSIAGFAQAIVICPMEHVKCRLQVQHKSDPNAFKGPIDCTKSILRSHGIPGIFRGFYCTLWREVPAFGFYFSVYDAVKDYTNNYLDSHGSESDMHTWFCSAFAGGVSGSFTWLVIYPVDVVKSRLQTAPLDASLAERDMWKVGRSLVKAHGMRYLFRGLGITLLRAFPVNGIIFPVYEFTLSHLTNLD